MSSQEFEKVMERLDRMERMLAQLAAGSPSPADMSAPPPLPAEIPEQHTERTIQEEGHYILATQGLVAYKRYWQDQAKKGKKARLRSAA